jgi:hypothetical protein
MMDRHHRLMAVEMGLTMVAETMVAARSHRLPPETVGTTVTTF